MADYSTASANANAALNTATDGGLIEEYEITETTQRVKLGKVKDQLEGAALAEGLAQRRADGSPFRVVTFRNARS